MREEQHKSDQTLETVHKYKTIEEIVSPHWVEGRVVANGMHQHYYRTGGDKPALVLLHGFSENALCWSRVAKALEQDYDVILVDARGHGLSSGPETGYSQEILTEDVVGLIHELGLQRPSLFGYSNGALTAAHVAATYPELVRSIILEDPPWSETPVRSSMTVGDGEPWPGFTNWFKAWIAWHKALRTQTPEERVAASREYLPQGALNWSEDDLMTHLESQAQFNLDVLNFTPRIPTRTSWRGIVERIECPIMLITGDPMRGACVTPQEAQKITETWHQGLHVSYEDASHFMHHEMQGNQFDQFMNEIKAFLSEY